MPCLGLGSDKQSLSRGYDVSRAVLITFVSESKSSMSLPYCLFHFGRPTNLRLAFDTAEKNGRFVRIQSQRGKESSSSTEKRDKGVFLFRRTVRVETGEKPS